MLIILFANKWENLQTVGWSLYPVIYIELEKTQINIFYTYTTNLNNFIPNLIACY